MEIAISSSQLVCNNSLKSLYAAARGSLLVLRILPRICPATGTRYKKQPKNKQTFFFFKGKIERNPHCKDKAGGVTCSLAEVPDTVDYFGSSR